MEYSQKMHHGSWTERLLDTLFRGLDERDDAAVAAVHRQAGKAMVRVAVRVDAGTFDRQATKAVADALAVIVDDRRRKLPRGELTAATEDALVAGAAIGVLVGLGGTPFAERRLGRLCEDVPMTEEETGPVSPMADLILLGRPIRRVASGPRKLLHGVGLFEVLGYADPEAALLDFLAPHWSDGVACVLPAPSQQGGATREVYLSIRGVTLALIETSPEMKARLDLYAFADAFADHLTLGDPVLEKALAEIASAVRVHMR